MPLPTSLQRKDQRSLIIENAIRDFQLHRPQKTLQKAQRDIITSWIIGIGVPILGVVAAFALKIHLFSFSIESPYMLFFTPIILSSWFGGIYSGILATLLGGFTS